MSSTPSASPSPTPSYSIYSHPPPLSAPTVFTTVFAIQILTTLFRCFCVRGPPSRKATGRKWWFIAVPAAVETVGYALRIASTLNQTSVGLYVSSLVIIVIAPQISAIVAYVVLIAIIVDLDANDLAPVRARHIAPIWLTLDLVAGALQGGGGGQQTNPGSVRKGLILALVGMVMQTLGFFVFSVIACVTLRRLSFTQKWAERRRALVNISFALGTSCGAHNVRFGYRVVEFTWQIARLEPGPYGYAPQVRPVFEYVFDATMMFFAIAVFPSFFYFGELHVPRIRGFEYWIMDREKRRVMHGGRQDDA